MTTIEKQFRVLFFIINERSEGMYIGYYESPIGLIEVRATGLEPYSILFVEEKVIGQENEIVTNLIEQLHAYFKDGRKEFSSFPLVDGTSFQIDVWSELIQIPYGKTTSYSQIASRIDKEKAVRAVGSAIGKNKLAIVVPCHRVVGKNGAVAGFAWGTWRKEWLIQHEKNHSQL
jgi:methylated-DNA-[protein]-cysteine S-methyltransferase